MSNWTAERVPDLRPRYNDGDRLRFLVLAARAWAHLEFMQPADGLALNSALTLDGQLPLRIHNFRRDRDPEPRFGDIPCLPYEVILGKKQGPLLDRLCKIQFITVHRRPDMWGTWPLEVIDSERARHLVYLPQVIAHGRGRFEIEIRSGTFRYGVPVRPSVEFDPSRVMASDYAHTYTMDVAFLEL